MYVLVSRFSAIAAVGTSAAIREPKNLRRVVDPELAATGSAVWRGTLHEGREREWRSAWLRESDDDERWAARFDRNERGVADIASRRRDRLGRVVDEDEPVNDLIAVGLVVVLDPDVVGRIKVQVG